MNYKAKKVLITGGLGFLGSNLAHKLVSLEAEVTLLDRLSSGSSKQKFANIAGIEKKVAFVDGDIGDERVTKKLVADKDIIFNFAANINHIKTEENPYDDMIRDCGSHLKFLEVCRKTNPHIRIIFSSSRLVLGKAAENPITENHPTNPLGFYGINKLMIEKYHLLYNERFGLGATIVRIATPYGERQPNTSSSYGIPAYFMRLAMEGKNVEIHGDGKQLRDYLYIDDLVEALLLLAENKNTVGEIYNCGYGKSVPFKKMADTILEITGSDKIVYIPRPKNFEDEETGHFEFDISKLEKAINWKPRITLEEGLKKMYKFYKHDRQ